MDELVNRAARGLVTDEPGTSPGTEEDRPMRTARWTIAMMTALMLTGVACSNGSSAGSGGGLYGGGAGPTSSAPSPTSGSSGSGGGGYGQGGYGTGGGGGGGGGQQSGHGKSVLTVTQANYTFTPSTPKVASGDRVTIENSTPDTPHTFTVDGENIDVTVAPGTSQDVTIDLPAGTYPFFCSFHQSAGMTGTLTVT
jgi:plastocyanin